MMPSGPSSRKVSGSSSPRLILRERSATQLATALGSKGWDLWGRTVAIIVLSLKKSSIRLRERAFQSRRSRGLHCSGNHSYQFLPASSNHRLPGATSQLYSTRQLWSTDKGSAYHLQPTFLDCCGKPKWAITAASYSRHNPSWAS
jgi:hypothetical protein